MLCDNSNEFHCRNTWRTYGDGAKCISLDSVCDGLTQCPFSDDEFPYPENYHQPRNKENKVEHTVDKCITSCLNIDAENWGCPGECIPTPDGPTCKCPDGLYFDNSVFQCRDVDECALHDRCQQTCVNFYSGFECHCDEGYVLEGKYSRNISIDFNLYLGTGNCKSKYPTTIVSILENRLEIHIGNEDGNITTMFKNSSIDFSVDFEFPVVSMTSNSDDQIIYWIDTRGMVHFMFTWISFILEGSNSKKFMPFFLVSSRYRFFPTI